MKAPLSVILAIGRAVDQVGGDLEDAQDLIDVWERLAVTAQPKADAMRRQARNVKCCCADEPEPGADGRCPRCYGQPKTHSQTTQDQGENP